MAGECQLKLSLLGDLGVGKTSIFMRFVHNTYTDDVSTTIGRLYNCVLVKCIKRLSNYAGADFVGTKTLQVRGRSVKLHLW